jgi:hypothetical protein
VHQARRKKLGVTEESKRRHGVSQSLPAVNAIVKGEKHSPVVSILHGAKRSEFMVATGSDRAKKCSK